MYKFGGLLCALLCYSNLVFSNTITLVDESGKAISSAIITPTHGSMSEESPVPAVMAQINKQFSPQIMAINVNQYVEFPNSDNIRHHIYSFSEAKSFEVKLYSGTEAPPVKFENRGVVVLGCNIHDQMLGFLYVTDKANIWQSNDNGQVSIDEGIDEITIWHPDLSIDHLSEIQIKLSDLNSSASSSTTEIVLSRESNALQPAKKRTYGSKRLSQRD